MPAGSGMFKGMANKENKPDCILGIDESLLKALNPKDSALDPDQLAENYTQVFQHMVDTNPNLDLDDIVDAEGLVTPETIEKVQAKLGEEFPGVFSNAVSTLSEPGEKFRRRVKQAKKNFWKGSQSD